MTSLSWPGLVKYQEGIYPKAVTHLSTNPARRKVTSADASNDVTTKPNRHQNLYMLTLLFIY